MFHNQGFSQKEIWKSDPTYLIIPPENQPELLFYLAPRRDISFHHGKKEYKPLALPPQREEIDISPYLAIKISLHSPESPTNNLHLHFVRRATLIIRWSLTHNPPSIFRLTYIITIHLGYLRHIFHPQWKLFCKVKILFQTIIGVFRKDKKKLRITLSTELTRIILPSRLTHPCFQELSIFSNKTIQDHKAPNKDTNFHPRPQLLTKPESD